MRITLYCKNTGELRELHAINAITREKIVGSDRAFIAVQDEFMDEELRLFPADIWEVYTVEQ